MRNKEQLNKELQNKPCSGCFMANYPICRGYKCDKHETKTVILPDHLIKELNKSNKNNGKQQSNI